MTLHQVKYNAVTLANGSWFAVLQKAGDTTAVALFKHQDDALTFQEKHYSLGGVVEVLVR